MFLSNQRRKFGRENFGELLVICQIHQNFLPPKFCIVRYDVIKYVLLFKYIFYVTFYVLTFSYIAKYIAVTVCELVRLLIA